MTELIGAREAAELVGLRYPTLLMRVRRGKVPFVRKGWFIFFAREDVIGGKLNVDYRKNMGTSAR
jgi:hypothetical protein